MGDELRVTFARPFEIVAFAHAREDCVTRRVVGRRGAFTFLFVAEGCLDLTLGKTPCTLRWGEAFLAPSSESRTLRLSGGREAGYFILQFRRNACAVGAPYRMLEIPDRAVLGNPGRMKDLLRLFAAAANWRPGSPLALQHLVVLMLCEMACSASRREAGMRADGLESVASRVDAYIAAHYHEHMGTPDIAREFRYNPDYLERVYREERHISIREAIHGRRIKEARAQLLLQKPGRIAEIADQCGYSDAGYFRRVFKRETKMTPQGFRAMNAREGVGRGDLRAS